MKPKTNKRSLVLYGLSLTVGLIAWSGHLMTIPLALFFPVLWVYSQSRLQGFLIALCYFVAASRGLAIGAATFYNNELSNGAILWVVASLFMSSLYYFLWVPRHNGRVAMIPVILLLSSIPPFGVIGWVNPLTAAGVITPGLGWLGLAFTLLLILLMATRNFILSPLKVISLFVLTVVPTVFANTQPVNINDSSWIGFDTEYPFKSGRDYRLDYDRITDIKRIIKNHKGDDTLVFPESAAGLWNDVYRDLWTSLKPKLNGKTVLIGAEYKNGESIENVLIKMDKSGEEILYYQRMPVPLAMWNPLSDNGFTAHWFDDPVIQINGKKAAVLICYEQLLMWPVLHSMTQKPEIIIAINNTWWAKNTSIPEIEKSVVTAWSRLFNVPLVTAFNI